jgi:hypothetical protein
MSAHETVIFLTGIAIGLALATLIVTSVFARHAGR